MSEGLIWQCRECTAMWNSEQARNECELIDQDESERRRA